MLAEWLSPTNRVTLLQSVLDLCSFNMETLIKEWVIIMLYLEKCQGHPHKMFHFPPPSISLKSVGRSVGQKKKKKKGMRQKERKENKESSWNKTFFPTRCCCRVGLTESAKAAASLRKRQLLTRLFEQISIHVTKEAVAFLFKNRRWWTLFLNSVC